MKKIIILFAVICFGSFAYSQDSSQFIIKDRETKEILNGVSIIIKNKTANKQVIIFSHSGYEQKTESFPFPLAAKEPIEILLSKEEEELEEVVVQTTRTSRTIQNTPTRVETIDGEELDEKNNMRPANVAMLLHESTGLQVQQTSATSANASIRVQGLDGRYTQLLKDGYPNFGNFASGLSILEIPPLDLKQVEVIKGPSSTLYGAGAIAGAINFISKTPKENAEHNFIFNQSNIGQTNIGAYSSLKKGKFGYSILGLLNYQKAYDVDKDDFSELPESNNFTINPRLFFYPTTSITIMLGNSFTKGESTGGDMHVINDKPAISHIYFEKNNTIRNVSTLEFDKRFRNKNNFKLKQSVSLFNRDISIPGYIFAGKNTNSFTDLSYLFSKKKHTVITGLNVVYDKFLQKEFTTNINQESFTSGIYAQDTWDISERVKMESGLRIDNVQYSNINYNKNKTFALPRLSVLFKITDKISSRIGAGLGYKVPTIFTEQTEAMQYRNLLPLNNVDPEKSIGGTADINYKTRIVPGLSFSINQLFFYTNIRKPLVLQTDLLGNSFFVNASKPVISRGFETNIKLIYKENLKLFAGYTYTDAKAGYLTGNQFLPLLPLHKVNLALVYEKENNFKLGFESYFNGNQYLYNGKQTPSYWELGFMAEKTIRKVALFINFENLTDERQSKYKRVVNGTNNNPVFDDIWNHTEGFVINGGIKVKL